MVWLALSILLSTSSSARLPWKYEAVHYATAPLDDDVARLQQKVAAGEATLTFDDEHGYLAA